MYYVRARCGAFCDACVCISVFNYLSVDLRPVRHTYVHASLRSHAASTRHGSSMAARRPLNRWHMDGFGCGAMPHRTHAICRYDCDCYECARVFEWCTVCGGGSGSGVPLLLLLPSVYKVAN